jgi:uracil-DNA glycosylase family 4
MVKKPQIPLDELRAQVEACHACPLAGGRTQIVFGDGNPHARVLFVGEAPGKNEDLQGVPFVGKAGQNLNALLEIAGLKREDVFIANVLKCRPPGNRDPRPEEIELCTPFLREQTRTIDPEFIVTLGNFATKFILKTEVGITRIAGHLTDNYDPRDNMLHLSDDNYSRGRVASVAVACHEAGHAVQNATGYNMMRVRTSLVPAVNFTSQTWGLLFIAGMMLGRLGIMQLAVAFFAVSVLFHIVTLPVEIDASRRAVNYLATVSDIDHQGAREVLTAAALTYVAAALTSIMQLMYYMSRTRSRD